jgi:hypothetical protein
MDGGSVALREVAGGTSLARGILMNRPDVYVWPVALWFPEGSFCLKRSLP